MKQVDFVDRSILPYRNNHGITLIWVILISKIKKAYVLKGTFSQTKYVCVLTYQISSFLDRGGVGDNFIPPSSKLTPKKPAQI